MNDREIAEELGVNKATVRYHRRKLGLNAQGHKAPFTNQQLIALHNKGKGMNDIEIAEELGVSPSTVGNHRRRLGLKTIKKLGLKPLEVKYNYLFTDQQLITLYEKGMIDREIAEELGVNTSTVAARRRKLGLKPLRFKR